MTISTSRGTELRLTDVVLRSYQLAGLLNEGQGTDDPSWPSKSAFGMDMLQSILASLQADGIFARQVTFTYLPLAAPSSPTSGTYIYALPSAVFDVVGTAMYIQANEPDVTQASGLTPVMMADREKFQRMSTNASQARPVLYYADRTVFPVQVYLWPTPNEAGTIRFQTIRLAADSEDGNATLDLERYWLDFILFELASRLAEANSLPADRVMRLITRAQAAKVSAKSYSHQHTPGQAHVMYGSAPRRRGLR